MQTHHLDAGEILDQNRPRRFDEVNSHASANHFVGYRKKDRIRHCSPRVSKLRPVNSTARTSRKLMWAGSDTLRLFRPQRRSNKPTIPRTRSNRFRALGRCDRSRKGFNAASIVQIRRKFGARREHLCTRHFRSSAVANHQNSRDQQFASLSTAAPAKRLVPLRHWK